MASQYNNYNYTHGVSAGQRRRTNPPPPGLQNPHGSRQMPVGRSGGSGQLPRQHPQHQQNTMRGLGPTLNSEPSGHYNHPPQPYQENYNSVQDVPGVPGVPCVPDNQNIQNMQNVQDVQDVQDVPGVPDAQEYHHIQDMQDMQDMHVPAARNSQDHTTLRDLFAIVMEIVQEFRRFQQEVRRFQQEAGERSGWSVENIAILYDLFKLHLGVPPQQNQSWGMSGEAITQANTMSRPPVSVPDDPMTPTQYINPDQPH
ncbi:hypothetical protein MY5147_009095 [Beauveria neobassiana]